MCNVYFMGILCGLTTAKGEFTVFALRLPRGRYVHITCIIKKNQWSMEGQNENEPVMCIAKIWRAMEQNSRRYIAPKASTLFGG